eukprot:gnl/TRDRNA2_/TRDRNA2_29195_c0_seq1.p1 gnl/TRDRNA2_/TRDRNA2_29195_c0~~gnl/TRDRNA2_/TRDRNA2_29195_c0_seq1.p1  ORF type:complete len:338 (+),score=25.91 gnl/TRDRNA2_/TRDRNA2_29195_c0_seq1:49-1062(+)
MFTFVAMFISRLNCVAKRASAFPMTVSSISLTLLGLASFSSQCQGLNLHEVAIPQHSVNTSYSLTGLMCAGSRWEESRRSDSLFYDPLAAILAGPEGRANPMGTWILVPRTRYGDDLLREFYHGKQGRQLVLLGAGMDARAWRLVMPELRVFEVDQPTTFDFKEPLVRGKPLTVKERVVVGSDFVAGGGEDVVHGNHVEEPWAQALLNKKFNRAEPTVWLLEGLVYYLPESDIARLMRAIGHLSAPGSIVFHDAITQHYVGMGIRPGGAPFVSGSDDYGYLWNHYAGFANTTVLNLNSVQVDRRVRALRFVGHEGAKLTPAQCAGQNLVLFVRSEKT